MKKLFLYRYITFFFILYTCADVNLYLFTKDRDNNVVRNAAAIADWHKRDLLARNYLIATLETQQQRVLVNCATGNFISTLLLRTFCNARSLHSQSNVDTLIVTILANGC